jgi:cyclopropane fatty-acyl-phospholipid synthase-like methyltransferase
LNIKKSLRLLKKSKVLDLGCGNGDLMLELVKTRRELCLKVSIERQGR